VPTAEVTTHRGVVLSISPVASETRHGILISTQMESSHADTSAKLRETNELRSAFLHFHISDASQTVVRYPEKSDRGL